MNEPAVIAMSRVSRLKDDAHSPEVQARLMRQFSERQKWGRFELRDENELNGGNVSGGADLSNRPLGKAIEDVERGWAKIILYADFSRSFRSIDIQRPAIDRIEAAGGELWSVSSGRVTHETAEAELQANIVGSVNHYQRRYARDKSFLAVEIAIEQGKMPWAVMRPGYLRNDDSSLRPDPALRSVIEHAFEMRAAGAKIAAVRIYLAANGIELCYASVMKMLSDRLYLGEIHFGSHKPNLTAHEPIVDGDLFEAVQKLKKLPRGRIAKSERILARLGILTCSGCIERGGGPGRMVVGRQTQNGREYPYYHRGRVTADCDDQQHITAPLTEETVVAYVKNALAGLNEKASAGSNVAEAKAELERAQADVDKALTVAMEAGSEPVVMETVRQRLEARDRAKERYKDELHADKSLSVAVTAGDWDDLTLDEQRDLIKAVIEKVVIHAGRGVERIEIVPR